jgi:1-acyl-sn-glycerol-3-phosphate acyltransferase
MDKGYNVLVFPEGVRVDHDQMNPFRGGVGILAKSVNATVVPIKIEGLYELKRQGKHFTRPGRISVIFGKAVHYREDQDPTYITQDLESRVKSLNDSGFTPEQGV